MDNDSELKRKYEILPGVSVPDMKTLAEASDKSSIFRRPEAKSAEALSNCHTPEWASATEPPSRRTTS